MDVVESTFAVAKMRFMNLCCKTGEAFRSVKGLVKFIRRSIGSNPFKYKNQLKDCLNSKGEKLVFFLNKLLNDCACSKPNS